MVSLLLAFIYLAFITLGLPDSALGSCWPLMHQVLGVDISSQGLVTMTISFGTIVSSFFSDKILRKFKIEAVIIISVFLTAVALFGFSFSTKFYQIILFSIPYGLGAGAIDSSLNNFVTLNYSQKHLSFLHAFWGIGAIISPNIMSYAIAKHNSYNYGYQFIGTIQSILLVVLFFSIPVWIKARKEIKNKDKVVVFNNLTIKEKLKIKNIFLVLIGFFGYCSMEATMFNWTSSYLVNYRNVSVSLGAAFHSLFFIGLALGRIISGFIGPRISDKNYIRIGTLIDIFGLILILIPFNTYIVALIGILIMGLFSGPIYPAIVHSTPNNFKKENSQAVIGLEMASAYIGSTFMPPLFGVIASKIGIKFLPVYCFIFIVLVLIMFETLNRRNKKCAVDAI